MRITSYLFLMLVQFLSVTALAGVDSSGGGNAMVCRNADQVILSAQVLDLFEAQVLYGLTPTISSVPAADQARQNIDKLIQLNKLATLQLDGVYQHVISVAHMLPNGIQLQPINDSFSPVAQKGCAIEQLAAYAADGNLYINSEIWRALDETNRAALYLHESVYKMMRDRGATNSIRTRKIVGHLISGYGFNSPIPGTKPGDLMCETPNSAFWDAPTVFFVTFVDDVATLSFVTLANNPLFDLKQLTVASTIFGTVGDGSAQVGMGWTSGNFESGDNVTLQNIGGQISIQLTNGLGNAGITGTFPVECH